MAKPRYKAVIFDYDDTLVESRIAKWAQHVHVAKKFYDIDIKEEELLKHWGKPLDVLLSELYGNSDTVENLFRVYMSTKDDFPKKTYKESLNLIKELRKNHIEVGILSAITKGFLVEDLSSHGFPVNDFIIIQGAGETLVHKPHPDVFLPIFEKLVKEGIMKKDIVYIGDSLDDLKASHGAGIDFIALTTGLYSREDFKKEGAKIILTDIGEVIKQII